MNRKDKALARTELRHGVILDDVFQNFISTDTIIFKVGNKVTSICSIDAFIIPYQDIMHLA